LILQFLPPENESDPFFQNKFMNNTICEVQRIYAVCFEYTVSHSVRLLDAYLNNKSRYMLKKI
jgi:hypothetical protein